MRRSLVGAQLLVATAALLVAFPAAIGQPLAPTTAASIDPWAAHDPASRRNIGYGSVDLVLKGFVIDEGRGHTSVPYDRLKGDGQRALGAIIAGFESIPVRGFNRDEQLAYWLNLRTMILLHQTIEDHDSVKPEAMLRGPDSFTGRQVVTIEGHKLSLADIDRLILKHWREPNVIYGLVLPARGGPALPRAAYRGATVHAQLNAAGREFVNRSGVVEAKAKTVRLSSFFMWHRETLGGDDAGLLSHVRTLAAPKLAAKLPTSAVITDRFDWELNKFSERSFDAAIFDRNTVARGLGDENGSTPDGKLGGGS